MNRPTFEECVAAAARAWIAADEAEAPALPAAA